MRDLLQLNTGSFMEALPPGMADRVRGEATVSKFSDGQIIQSRGDTRAGLSIIKSGAEVTAEPLPEVIGHPELIRQVLKNLIENALKYRSDEPPRVRVSALDEPAEWTISVHDNGIGIEPDHSKNIFRIFQRLHRRDDIPGIGIGLAICRKIVEVHRGRIWLDSTVESGTRFCFSLPRKIGS